MIATGGSFGTNETVAVHTPGIKESPATTPSPVPGIVAAYLADVCVGVAKKACKMDGRCKWDNSACSML